MDYIDLLYNNTNTLYICATIFCCTISVWYLLYKNCIKKQEIQKQNLKIEKLTKENGKRKKEFDKLKLENQKLKKENENLQKFNKKLKNEIFAAKRKAAEQWQEIERDIKIRETIKEEVLNVNEIQKEILKTNEEKQNMYGVARGFGTGLGIMLGLKKQ